MDPISITLAVVTFATALKDIIGTASAIQDAFSKHPQNYKDAQKLARTIFITVEQLKEIYEEKKEIIDGKPSLKRALDDLLREMKRVHEECIRLLPPVSRRKRDKFKIAFYSFWRRKEVERLISGLNEDVNDCLSRFNTLASVRTETRVIKIQDTLMVSSARIEARAEDIHRSITSSGHTYDHGIGLRSATPTHLFTFAGSSCMPMTWIPDTIPTHELSKAYLRREIARIDMSLLLGPVLRWLRDNPEDGEPLAPSSWHLEQPVKSDVTVHQEAVIFTLQIQSLLQEPPSYNLLLDLAYTISYLGRSLEKMEMFEDWIHVENLATHFWGHVTQQFPSQKFKFQHAEALTGLATAFAGVKNRFQTQSAIRAAINILQNLVQNEPDEHWRIRYNGGIAENTILQAKWELDRDRALQLVASTENQLWKAFGHDQLSAMDTSRLSPDNWMNLGFTNLFRQDITIADDNYLTCAWCLLGIAKVQLNHDRCTQSNHSAKLSLEIAKYLLRKFPDSERIQDFTQTVLAHLSEPIILSLNPLDENREYTRQNIAILRKLVQTMPQRYVISLGNAFMSEWKVLMELGRFDEAETVYQDMCSLRHLAAIPPHLSINIPSKIEGDYFLMIALSHYNTDHLSDAVAASRNAIAQYSALEFINPGCSRKDHIRTLVLLCESLNVLGQHKAAISEGFKALNIIDQYVPASKLEKIQSHHEDILYGIVQVLRSWKDSEAIIYSKSINIIDQLQRISSSGEVKLPQLSARAAVDYMQLLQERGCTEEAIKFCQELRNTWTGIFGSEKDSNSAIWYLYCLDEMSELQGHIGKMDIALCINEEAFSLFLQLMNSFDDLDESHITTLLTTITSTRIDLLLHAGRYVEAMELCQKRVEDIRRDPNYDLVKPLNTLSYIQRLNCMPHNALTSAKEALLLSQTLEDDALVFRSLIALTFSHADLGNMDEVMARLDDAEDAIMSHCTVSSLEELKDCNDRAYITILFLRSILLFTKGDYAEATVLVEKVAAIERKYSTVNEDVAQGFCDTLMYSRILFCALERHKEGIAAATELTEIWKSLTDMWPGLGRKVQVRLDNMVRRGWWKPIQQVKDNLTCGHQDHF